MFHIIFLKIIGKLKGVREMCRGKTQYIYHKHLDKFIDMFNIVYISILFFRKDVSKDV